MGTVELILRCLLGLINGLAVAFIALYVCRAYKRMREDLNLLLRRNIKSLM